MSFGSFSGFGIMNNELRMGEVNKNIGFSLGGAKDINSFRLSIKNHKIPNINSITFDGIFGEYFFDTNPTPELMNTNGMYTWIVIFVNSVNFYFTFFFFFGIVLFVIVCLKNRY